GHWTPPPRRTAGGVGPGAHGGSAGLVPGPATPLPAEHSPSAGAAKDSGRSVRPAGDPHRPDRAFSD
ncbi:hypothetical protein ABTJ92_20745, partial [Acinetobacter baumannii]